MTEIEKMIAQHIEEEIEKQYQREYEGQMMTIEEAIENLNGCIVSEEYASGKPNGNITCDLTREILNMAISALREKAERKKGCMRCNHGKGFYTGNAWIYIGSDGSLSITTSQETIVDFPKNTISHCPWCGRKLKEVQA